MNKGITKAALLKSLEGLDNDALIYFSVSSFEVIDGEWNPCNLVIDDVQINASTRNNQATICVYEKNPADD